MVNNMRELVGTRSLLMMYRDCLKATPLMNPSKQAQKGIAQLWRIEFEKQRHAESEVEVEKFKEGIVRTLSNLTLFEISKQYKENPAFFDKATRNIHEETKDEDIDEAELAAAEKEAAKHPFL